MGFPIDKPWPFSLYDTIDFYKDQCRLWREQDERNRTIIAEQARQLAEGISPPAPPTILGTLDASLHRALYTAIFPAYTNRMYWADNTWLITARGEMQRFINWSDVNKFPFTAEIKDCDDAAAALYGEFAKYPQWSGYPANLIWGRWPNENRAHAFYTEVSWPSFANRTPTVYLVEPQTDLELSIEIFEGMELLLLVT